MYYSTTYLSPLGKITLACDACGKNLVGLWLEGQKYYQGTLKAKTFLLFGNFLLIVASC